MYIEGYSMRNGIISQTKRRSIIRIMVLVCGILLCSTGGIVSAGVWTDPFDGTELVEGWKFRDYRDKVTTFEVKDGLLQMTNPKEGWGHTTPETSTRRSVNAMSFVTINNFGAL